MTGSGGDLHSLTFAEHVVVEGYKAAAAKAVSDADTLADKIVTASFSVATAYGAVVALVTPKDSPSTMLIVAPFVVIAGAIGLALLAQSFTLPLQVSNDFATVQASLASTTSKKRWTGRGALAVLAIGVALAGYAIYETYGPGAEEDKPSTAVELWLTTAGEVVMTDACGTSKSPVSGMIHDTSELSETRVEIVLDATVCTNGAGTLVLPQKAISAAKVTG
jgi:hypothetical protein